MVDQRVKGWGVGGGQVDEYFQVVSVKIQLGTNVLSHPVLLLVITHPKEQPCPRRSSVKAIHRSLERVDLIDGIP